MEEAVISVILAVSHMIFTKCHDFADFTK